MLYHFNSIDLLTLLSKIVTVSSGGHTDLQNTYARTKILFDISHGGQVFYHTTMGAKAVIFVVAPIILGE